MATVLRRVAHAGVLVVLGVGLGATPARSQAGRPDVSAAAFLAGCWEARQQGGATVEEQWTAPRGGVMLGLSRSVRDGTARGWEHLLLSVKEGRLTYTALPSGQAETAFPLAEAGEGSLDFRNPAHDFPRRIAYRAAGPDSLYALVYGGVDDAEPAFRLRYGRVDCGVAMGGGPGPG